MEGLQSLGPDHTKRIVFQSEEGGTTILLHVEGIGVSTEYRIQKSQGYNVEYSR